MNSLMLELVYRELKDDINDLALQVERVRRIERAEIADSIPAYNLADAPTNASGGMGTGASYVTVAWIKNGRKSGEGAGAGTGVLAVFQSSSNQWLRLTDYTAVVT